MNRLLGTIVGFNSNGHVFQVVVQVGSVEITAVAVDITPSHPDAAAGKKAGIVFKEAETALALDLPPHSLSIRNRLPCRVIAVEDDGILANVRLDYEGNPLCALITSGSAGDLAVAPGKMVNALIKSTEVMIDLEGE
jgi:molybdopterin-binding protein